MSKLSYPLDVKLILGRLEDIKNAVKELEVYPKMDFSVFKKDRHNFALTSYYLRLAIEALLTIGTHILARLPSNGKKKDYTKVILSLADYSVIPEKFAQKIKGMAGYRNRLVHLYWRVEQDELYKTIQENLDDFNQFIDYIKKFLAKT